ncbi:MAG: virulence factor SrfB, partial [Desulfovibrionaceae bacterium]
MRNPPSYKSPVSLIPQGCPQYLDFDIETPAFSRLRRYFREEQRPDGEYAGRQKNLLCCLMEEDGMFLDMVTRQPKDFDYEIDGRKALEPWLGQWLPAPFLRKRDQQWPGGEERFECGPGNWARFRFDRSPDDPALLYVTLVFDMTVEPPPAEGEQYHALSPNDVSSHGAFKLAHHVRDNAWFLNSGWVDEWLFSTWSAWLAKGSKRRQESDYVLEYLASYLTVLDVLRLATGDITVQVINPESEIPVDVDLILDIGNSRTTGILIETLPQKITNLNDSYLLQLRD